MARGITDVPIFGFGVLACTGFYPFRGKEVPVSGDLYSGVVAVMVPLCDGYTAC